MDMFEIEGGVPLHGEVTVSGSKNAALPMMAAAILANGKVTLRGVPHLKDIDAMIVLLRELGVEVEWSGTDTLELEVRDESLSHATYKRVKVMRASICVLGPLVAKRKHAQVALPGGCNIGPRPIQLHLKGLRALGAEVEIEHGDVMAESEKLFGNDIYLGGPNGSTVLGTANVMSAAVLAEGHTLIEDAACEPEIAELARLLNKMGARISGIGTKRLVIEGVEELRGTDYDIPPDRIEAGTFLVAGALTGGNILVHAVRRDDHGAVFDALRSMGINPTPEQDGCRVIGPDGFEPVDLTTGPFPALPTDMQAQLMTPLCLAKGISVITERVFPDRFMHIMELNRMRAKIRKEGALAIIEGVDYLSGAPVMASDLRASAALVLAALVARGKTTVDRVYHIDRGYERIEEKLAALGAKIRRIPSTSDPLDGLPGD